MADPHTKELAIATLAAGIITARKAVDVKSIRAALLDAEMIIGPKKASDPAYKEWQVSHGETPTTPEEDQAAQKRYSDGMANLARSVTGRMRR